MNVQWICIPGVAAGRLKVFSSSIHWHLPQFFLRYEHRVCYIVAGGGVEHMAVMCLFIKSR